MSIVFVCPSCKKSMRIPDHAAGHTIRCKKCHGNVRVPLQPGMGGGAFRKLKSLLGLR